MSVVSEPYGIERGPARRRRRRRLRGQRVKLVQYVAVVAASLLIWQVASQFTKPLFLPSPGRVGDAALDMLRSGDLLRDVGATYYRVLVGWAIGSALAIPLGLVAARVRLVRLFVQPYIDFFRFIPPLAFISLAILWLGVGQSARISLIVYAAFFTVFLNTVAGGASVEREKIQAAESLGASRTWVLRTVVVPATVPYIITGLQVALGIAFMTVVAAELVAADTGVGFLIWNARVFGQTEAAFVGVIALGLMGFLADAVLRAVVRRFLGRYTVGDLA